MLLSESYKNRILELAGLVSEKRSNPEINVDQPIFQQILDFVEKYSNQEELIFVSFRDSINVTFINPKNEFDTPTGLYTYPWKNYFKIKFEEQIRDKIGPSMENTVPFAGERQYMFMYKLKSLQDILTNETTYEELLPYAQRLLQLFPNKKIIKIFLEDEEEFISYIRRKSKHFRNNLPPVHLFQILLYEIVSQKTFSSKKVNENKKDFKIKNKKTYWVSSLYRDLGINGLIDLGTGFIHPNEKYQAVFFKGRGIFDDIKIINLKESNRIVLSKTEEDNVPSNYILKVLRSSKYSKNIDNVIKGLIHKFGSNLHFVDISNILEAAKNKIQIVELIIDKKIKNLTTYDLSTILNLKFKELSADEIYNFRKQVINKIINSNISVLPELESHILSEILYLTENLDAVFEKINPKNLKDLNKNLIVTVLEKTKNIESVVNLLGTKNLEKLNTKDLDLIFLNSFDLEKTKNALSKFFPKESINNTIEHFNLKTELIPESHLIHDFRKTIRKLIKENYK